VDFFLATREHELRVWREAVTDWFVYLFFLFWLLKLTAIGSLSGILRPYSPLSIHGCYHVSFLSSAGQYLKLSTVYHLSYIHLTRYLFMRNYCSVRTQRGLVYGQQNYNQRHLVRINIPNFDLHTRVSMPSCVRL